MNAGTVSSMASVTVMQACTWTMLTGNYEGRSLLIWRPGQIKLTVPSLQQTVLQR